jgi:hypothetical protein
MYIYEYIHYFSNWLLTALRTEAVGTGSWPLTNYCRSQEYMDLYVHSPIHHHRGLVLNLLSTGTTLHLPLPLPLPLYVFTLFSNTLSQRPNFTSLTKPDGIIFCVLILYLYMLCWLCDRKEKQTKANSVAWVRERTIPTERLPLVDEVGTNFLRIEGCRVVSVTDPYGHILGFLDRSSCFFFQVAPQFYSRGWVNPVPGPLLLRKSGSAGNRTRTSGSVATNSDH